MTLEVDIMDRVQADFSGSEGQKALDELLTSGKAGRIARCIVFGAQGSLERLREHIRMADTDWRKPTGHRELRRARPLTRHGSLGPKSRGNWANLALSN